MAGSKASTNSLTYDQFVGFGCSQNTFFTTATGHLDIDGPVTADGTTTLDGVPYDTYPLNLGTGPATFETPFDRTFAPPPPSSATYTFVFSTSVRQGGRALGRSITTIRCTSGVFSAANAWVPSSEPIPAGLPAAWAALALLLAAAGGASLTRRRA